MAETFVTHSRTVISHRNEYTQFSVYYLYSQMNIHYKNPERVHNTHKSNRASLAKVWFNSVPLSYKESYLIQV